MIPLIKLPSGLRDNPMALALALLCLIGVIVALGALTARIGAEWAQRYVVSRVERNP